MDPYNKQYYLGASNERKINMLESDMEYLISKYPKEFFPKLNLLSPRRQFSISGRRIDILFKNEKDEEIIIEIKKGILSREAVGQIAEYYGLLKARGINNKIHLLLCANTIPNERKCFLQEIGIECYEFSEEIIDNISEKYNYKYGTKVEPVKHSIDRKGNKTQNGDNTIILSDLLNKIQTIEGKKAIENIVDAFNNSDEYSPQFKRFLKTFQCCIFSVEEKKYFYSFIVNINNLHLYIMNPARYMLLMENKIENIKEAFPGYKEKSNEIIIDLFNSKDSARFLSIVK